MFDCAEGTVRQFEAQPYRPAHPRLRSSQVSKIFITHMHADHLLGVVAIMTQVMSGIGVTEGQLERLRKEGLNRRVSEQVMLEGTEDP